MVYMDVEARRLDLFPSHQLIGNREMMMIEGGNGNGNNNNTYNNNNMLSNAPPIGYGVPQSGTMESLLPIMYSSVAAESGLTTYTTIPPVPVPVSSSRKRSRDHSIRNPPPFISGHLNNHHHHHHHTTTTTPTPCSASCDYSTFLGQDISFQIQQHQSEIDRYISQHTEKVRLEMEERRKRYSRSIMATVEEGILKKLRSKEEEIEKIGKLNWALEERVKSLCIENQIWRDLAHNNEATANLLRSNLEQVMAQQDHYHRSGGAGLEEALMDDAQSCCGSNCGDGEVAKKDKSKSNDIDDEDSCNSSSRWLCRKCWKYQSCVLLLPCRHLSLCTLCASSVHTCPICNSTYDATLHLNSSSSSSEEEKKKTTLVLSS